jgi:NADPH-dependent 2,4-dienoyl-CoA reductase/sulfur reductase-like enzyme/rhodanese-related sulfurtransferase
MNKLVIVGGVAGGASAAARARRLSEQAEIVIFERGPDISFANCGLPYYVGDEISDRKKLLVTTPERLKQRFNIDVRIRSEVVSIDRAAKTVQVRDLNSGRVYVESYDRLLLSPGAAPLRPNIPGANLPGIFTLRNLEDVDRIKQRVTERIRKVVLLGAGFINLELAENLVRQGVSVTLVERNDQILPPFDREMTTPIVEQLQKSGVELLLKEAVQGFDLQSGELLIRLQSGNNLTAQMVILGIGVQPENRLAVDAGLEVGPRGGIRVNAHLQTSDPDIFAVGDAIEVNDFVSRTAVQVPLAGPANRQGRIAADNICGRITKYRGTQGTAILGFFDNTIAISGASEKALRRNSIDFRKVYVHPTNHAGYYPGADPMTLKLLFETKSGKLLGAQGVGRQGVDKRIDVLSVAIQTGMTVFDLEEMELAYAPQFGSAKDPVNMAGFVASGLLRGDHPQMDIDGLMALPIASRPVVIDVRTQEEFSRGHIPEARNIPIDELRSRLSEIPKDQALVVNCEVGQRGYLAVRILLQNGFNAANLGGGYRTYRLYQFDPPTAL